MKRDRDTHSRPMASGQTPDFEDAAEQRSPLTHAEQPHRLAIGNLLRRNAPAIIFHLECDPAIFLPEIDGNLRRASVADDIGERLLENPEKGRAEVLLQKGIPKIAVDIAPNPGAVLKFVGLPFQGGHQSQMIQDARPQLAGDAANHLDG